MKTQFDPRKAVKVRGKKFREGISTPLSINPEYRDYAIKSNPVEHKLVGITDEEFQANKVKVSTAWLESIKHSEEMANRPIRVLQSPPQPEPQPEPIPYTGPVGIWSIVDFSELKGIKLENPRPHPVTGKMSNYMRFAIPLLTVTISRSHWDGATIVIKRNTKGQVKVTTHIPGLHGKITRERLEVFFGKPFGTHVANMLEMLA